MRCGHVSCYYTMGDEPRGAGEAGGANFVVTVPEEVNVWLGSLPRLLTLGPTSDDPVWVDAITRCRDWDELTRLTDEQSRATASMPPGRRLMQARVPDAPFPAQAGGKWARELWWYIAVHELLKAPDDIPVETLVQQAKVGSATHYLAVDRLLRRPDIPALLSEGLRASYSGDWGTWLTVLRWDCPPRRDVIAALGEGLARFPITPQEGLASQMRGHIALQDLLESLVALRVPSAWCEDSLLAFQGRIGDHDRDLVAAISRTRRTLTELK